MFLFSTVVAVGNIGFGSPAESSCIVYIAAAGSDGAGSLIGADAMESPGPGAGAGARPGALLAAAYKVQCVSLCCSRTMCS